MIQKTAQIVPSETTKEGVIDSAVPANWNSPSFSGKKRRALGGLLIRKECWTVSRRGKLLLLMAAMVLGIVVAKSAYPFLAVTHPCSSEVLVVEGWIPGGGVEEAFAEFEVSRYRDVLVVDEVYRVGNKWDSGRYKSEYIAETLLNLGLPKSKVHVILCEAVKKDRTFSLALAVKGWLQDGQKEVESLDVLTLGTHARRSRLLFQRALGEKISVGVIALREKAYDPEHWWRSSEGVREVPFECVAYLYAKYLFGHV